jgi:nucleotide-binding universal stress UspA family protein
MLKSILVPLDGTPLAEAALPYAKALATRTGAKLTLVRAAHYAGLLGDVAVDQYRAVERAEEYLATLVEQLTSQGYAAQAGVTFGGSAADWIVEETDIRHADLVIMATHDRVGPDRLLHGSVAEAVVHKSAIPVMLVRSGEATPLAERLVSTQPAVVVPLDGSELAEAALPYAAEIARSLGGRVVFVGAVPAPGQLIAGIGGAIVTYSDSEIEDLQASAQTYLEGCAQTIDASGKVEIEVRFGDAARQIAEVAREYSAAMVVMATHGRTGVVRSILGSVAGGVVHQSEIPVVLVRARVVRAPEPATATANQPALVAPLY